MIFAREIPEIYMIIGKKYFPNFGGGNSILVQILNWHVPPLPPTFPMPMIDTEPSREQSLCVKPVYKLVVCELLEQ